MARRLKLVKKSLGKFVEGDLGLKEPFSVKVTKFTEAEDNKYFFSISYNVYRSKRFRKSYNEDFLVDEDSYEEIFGRED